MKPILKFIGILTVFSCIAGWLFYADGFAVDKTTRYRPLANGWVSYHAAMYLEEGQSFFEKLKKNLSDDLVHGRFRPFFTFYVSTAYAFSPILHKRSVKAEGRPYDQLMTGDLQLYSYILLGSVAASLVFMSLLIYRYTKEIVYALIPTFYIPLSPSLTENLLQNYIDSQEIPLVLWLSGWFLFFFLAVKTEKTIMRVVYLIMSSCFLFSFFLTKETSVILSIALISVTVLILFSASKDESRINLFIIASVMAVFCSVAVYLIVSMGNKGYATNYGAFNIEAIRNALPKLWAGFSKYSLNNIYGYIPILIYFAIAVKERKTRLNGLPMIKHISLLVFLLLICCGFFLIIVPWRPILIKYLFPSVFFFSFAVALSLSLLTKWAKERYGIKGHLAYLLLLPYFFQYNTFAANAGFNRDYWADMAGYGVSAIDRLADSIDCELNRNQKQNQAIFVEYGTDNVSWAKNIAWGKLHLMRILNLDKGVNLVNQNGDNILNYRMPKAELTSFRVNENGTKLYLSNDPKEFAARRFDAVYKGYKMTEVPKTELAVDIIGTCYQVTDEHIDWQGRLKILPSFSIFKYIPVDCQARNTQ
jgi:hypothetical protein